MNTNFDGSIGCWMSLYYCPRCRAAFLEPQLCPHCSLLANEPPNGYIEELLVTVLSSEIDRVAMAIDILTLKLKEPRCTVPLMQLLDRTHDPYAQVLGARGLGRLRAEEAVPRLCQLLLDESQPFVARISAAEALGLIGGEMAHEALLKATKSPRSSVANASRQALISLSAHQG